MSRLLALIYGVVAYVLFLGVFLYLIGFLANVVVPKSVDTGVETPLGLALLINVGIIAIFGVQHAIMARPAFKKWWTQFVPKPIERSTYVLISNIIFIVLFWQWRPMTDVVWNVTNPVGAGILWGLFGLGWAIILLASFLINHFDLFGLRQVWLYFRGIQYSHAPFRQPFLYKFVRHPLMVGWIVGFWATPHMTVGHLVFALANTAYILIGIKLEERDLTTYFGEQYLEYKKRVRGLIPLPKRRPSATARARLDVTGAEAMGTDQR